MLPTKRVRVVTGTPAGTNGVYALRLAAVRLCLPWGGLTPPAMLRQGVGLPLEARIGPGLMESSGVARGTSPGRTASRSGSHWSGDVRRTTG